MLKPVFYYDNGVIHFNCNIEGDGIIGYPMYYKTPIADDPNNAWIGHTSTSGAHQSYSFALPLSENSDVSFHLGSILMEGSTNQTIQVTCGGVTWSSPTWDNSSGSATSKVYGLLPNVPAGNQTITFSYVEDVNTMGDYVMQEIEWVCVSPTADEAW